MNRDPESWTRLGRAVRSDRQRQGLSRDQLAQQAGVSPKSIQSAEEGRVPRGRWPYTLDAIERGLGWASGSMQAILDGGMPTPEDDPRSSEEPSGNTASGVKEVVERVSQVYELGRWAADMGADPDARDQFEKAAKRMIESISLEEMKRRFPGLISHVQVRPDGTTIDLSEPSKDE